MPKPLKLIPQKLSHSQVELGGQFNKPPTACVLLIFKIHQEKAIISDENIYNKRIL